MFWYQIYSANNWGDICQLWGVCAPFGRRVADCAFTRMCIFKKKHILHCNPTPSN